MKTVSWQELPSGYAIDLYIETKYGWSRKMRFAYISVEENRLLLFECSGRATGEDGCPKILQIFPIFLYENIEVLKFEFDGHPPIYFDTIMLAPKINL